MSSNVIALPEWMRPEVDGYDGWGDDEVQEKVTSYSFYKDSPEGETVLFYDDAAHAYYRFSPEGNRVDIPGVTTVLKDVGPSKPLMVWAVKLAIETMRNGLVNEDGSFKRISTEDFNWLLDDAKTKHSQELQEAGDVGHIVHGLLEDAIKKAIKETNGVLQPLDFPPTDPRVLNSTNAALEWTQAHKVRFTFTERKVYSKFLEIAGTGDGLAWVSSCEDPTCCTSHYTDRLAFVDWKTSRSTRSTYFLQTAAYRFAYIEETGDPVTDTWILKLSKDTGKLEATHRGPETFEMELNAFISALELYRNMDAVEESLTAQKAVKRAVKKSIKAAADAIIEAEERAQRFQNKLLRMQATKDRNVAKKALYDQLRQDGLSVLEAKAQVAIEFPPKAAKEEPEEPEADIELNEVEVKVVQSVQPVVVEELPDGVEYVVKL